MKLRQLLQHRTVRISLLIYGVFALILAGVAVKGSKPLPREFPAIAFSLDDVFGSEQKVTYEANRGRPVILYFFASW